MQSDFAHLSKHSFIYFVANVIPSLVSFVALSLYTRLLDPSEYGLYYLIYSGAILVMSMVFGGFGVATARFWSGKTHHEDKIKYLSTYFYLMLLLFVVSSLLGSLFIFLYYFNYFHSIVLFWGIGVYITQSLFQISLDYLRAELKPVYYGLMNCTKAMLTLLLSVLFIYLGYGVGGLLAGIAFANLIVIVLFFSVNNRWLSVKYSEFDYKILKELLRFALPVSVGFALAYIVGNSDRWLLTWLLSVKAAGLYSAAYNLPLYSLTVIMSVVNLAAYPIVVKQYETKGVNAAREQLHKQFFLFMALILPACVGFLMLDHNIVRFVLGIQFRNTAILLMPWVLLATILSGIKCYYSDIAFQLGKNTVALLWVSLFTAIANVILNLVLIPYYGIMGSVISSVLAFLVGLMLSVFYGKRFFVLPYPILKLWRIFVSTIAMAIVLSLINSWRGIYALIFQIIIGGFVYGMFLLIFYWKLILSVRSEETYER